jgi:hypothetical protein
MRARLLGLLESEPGSLVIAARPAFAARLDPSGSRLIYST